MVIWIIGLPGSGKTTIGKHLYERVNISHSNCVFIDGDDIRKIMMNDLGHSLEDRKINASRIRNLCKHLDSQNINVICSILSLFKEDREWNRLNYNEYYEVYLDVPMAIITQRNQKGLYSSSENKNVVGYDIAFSPPEYPDLTVKNIPELTTAKEAADLIFENVKDTFYE